MAEPIQDGAGQSGIVVKSGSPLCGNIVGGENDGCPLVTGADDLEEEVAALLVQGQVAEFVEDEQLWGGVLAQGGGQIVGANGTLQSVDNIDGIGEKDAFACQCGGVANGGSQMAFAQPGISEKEEVFLALQKIQGKEAFDGLAGDFFWPFPIEGIEGFDDGKASGAHAALSTLLVAGEGFDFDEAGEVAEVVPALAGGLPGELQSV